MALSRRQLDLKMKLDWAKLHLQEFECEVSFYLGSNPYRVVKRDDVLNGLHIRTIESAPMDDAAAMRLSDFIYQLRSTLDHLAWQLCLIGNPRPSEREARSIIFPVLERDDDEAIKRLTKGMPEQALQVVREVQPFNHPNGTSRDALWQLNKLSNLDKHRVIAMGAGHSIDAFVAPEGCVRELVGYAMQFRWPLALKDQVIVEPYAIRLLVGEPPGDAYNRFEVPYRRISEIYEEISTRVVPRFMPFLA